MFKRYMTVLSLAVLLAWVAPACGGDKKTTNEDVTDTAGGDADVADADEDQTEPGCDPACEEGFECKDKECVAIPPVCDPACADDEDCVDGACVPKPCEGDGDCDGKCEDLTACETCVCGGEGACEAEAIADCCLEDGDCDDGFECTDNACVEIPTQCDPPCEDGFKCVDDACVEICDPLCDDGQMCVDGECVDTCDPPCDDDEQCVEGECIPKATLCSDATDPDAACDNKCGMMGVCTTCTCNMEAAACEPIEDTGDHCCKTLDDCDDDNPLTTDTCPTPGAACTHVSDPYLCPDAVDTVLLNANFDQGAMMPSFSVSYDNDDQDKVTWQLTSAETHSGAYAVYYGDPECFTYYTGTMEDCMLPDIGEDGTASPVNGILRSEDITLTESCVHVLTFWTRFEGEPTWTGMEENMPDQLKVYISEGSERTRVFASALATEDNHTDDAWKFYVADLTGWYGTTVRIEFEFDTYDMADNYHFGVLLDDIQVRTAPSTAGVGPCDAFNPCPDDGDVCTEDGCTFFVNDNTGKGFCAYFKPDPHCEDCVSDDDCTLGGDCETGTCQANQCSYDVDMACCTAQLEELLLDWNFDTGLGAWTVAGTNSETVGWQVDTDFGADDSPSLYFGDPATDTYVDDTLGFDGPVGKVLSEEVIIQGGSAFRMLTFDLWMSTEFDGVPLTSFSNPMGTDRLTLYVEHAGELNEVWSSDEIGGSTYLLDEDGAIIHEFRSYGADVTPWAGKAVRFVFEFDANDAENNDFGGVYLDNVELQVACAPPCTSDDQCDSNACTSSACIGGVCVSESMGDCCGVDLPPCDDGDDCTVDSCAGGVCKYQYSTDPACCTEGEVANSAFDFEGITLDAFSIAVDESAKTTWMISDTQAAGGAGSSLWFGNADTGTYENYNGTVPAAAFGTISFPSFQLPHAGIPVLEFDVYLETEWSQTGAMWTIPEEPYDKLTVMANNTEVWNSYVYEIGGHTCGTSACQFASVQASLDAVSGQNVTIKFQFDSLDQNDNGYAGVFVDNVRVQWYCSPFDCYSSLDCDDANDPGDVCTKDRCIDNQCEFEETGATGCCYSDEFAAEDFEDANSDLALSGQSGNVKWQVLSLADGGKVQAGDFGLYYGDLATMTYENPGQPVAGEAIWQIAVPALQPGEAPYMLEWWQYLDLKDVDVNVSDKFTVMIEDPSGGTNDIIFSNKAPVYGYYKQWRKEAVSLEDYAGKNVFVLFQFDSGDEIDNDGEGVYLDSLRVYKGCN